MIRLLFRILWRLIVLLLGVFVSIVIVNSAFPYLDKRLPAVIVIVFLWAISAYFIIPALIRLWRIVIKPNHLPVYATTGDGWASDPVNIAIICRSQSNLIKAMKASGWELTDKGTLLNNLRAVYAMVLNKPYATAPMSRLYLFGRSQDIGFQLQDGDKPTPRHRHHVRFWRLETPKNIDDHHDFWHTLMKLFKHRRSQIWIGAATHDVSFVAFRMRNLQITHKIDEDTNKERDYLINTLTEAGRLRGGPEDVTSGHKLKFRGQTFGVNIIVDGRLKVVRLKGFLKQ